MISRVVSKQIHESGPPRLRIPALLNHMARNADHMHLIEVHSIDWQRFQSLFLPGARLGEAGAEENGKPQISFRSVDEWLRAIKPLSTSGTNRDEVAFSEVVRLIGAAREKAIQTVNAALIDLYWEIGATISRKIEAAEWGDGTVDRLALFIARTQPGLRGFSRPNLFRMKQFYEAYREEPIVSPLVRQLPWSHHLVILGQSKRQEEREFYVRLGGHRIQILPDLHVQVVSLYHPSNPRSNESHRAQGVLLGAAVKAARC